MLPQHPHNRRHFLRTAAIITTGSGLASMVPATLNATPGTGEELNIIGPRAGFAPQVGTLVSMLNWMRWVILRPVQKMTPDQLDYLHDAKSNTIGAMLMHLAATERFYQLNTFDGLKWGTWDDAIKKEWETAAELGEGARQKIKGNKLEHYTGILEEVRAKSIAEFKKRDDDWLMQVDKNWPWGPTNNYCKWFHVCEHESNHNGQIKWIRSRLPGATAKSE